MWKMSYVMKTKKVYKICKSYKTKQFYLSLNILSHFWQKMKIDRTNHMDTHMEVDVNSFGK